VLKGESIPIRRNSLSIFNSIVANLVAIIDYKIFKKFIYLIEVYVNVNDKL